MPTDAPTVEADTDTRQGLAPQWKVLLLDDDVTEQDFVVWLLVKIFHKPRLEAIRLMWEVHDTGAALITVTSLERAELYVEQVTSLARPRGFPLRATIEPA